MLSKFVISFIYTSLSSFNEHDACKIEKGFSRSVSLKGFSLNCPQKVVILPKVFFDFSSPSHLGGVVFNCP